MNRYLVLISEINCAIKEFEGYLNPLVKIPELDKNYLQDVTCCWNLTETIWSETKFPNARNRGVYFLLGRNKNNEYDLAVYIGKASFNSSIASRLNIHLNGGDKENKIYPYGDYLLEAVITIALDKNEDLAFLAPALEEFIIGELQTKNIKLLNTIGKN